MNQQEAIAHFDANACRNIIVAHRTSGIEYIVHRDVVDAADAEYVYGDRATPHPRRKNDYRWFYLKSVDFVGAK